VKLFLILVITFFTFPTYAHEQDESVYDRVMRTGEIRCGYWNWEPLFTVNSNNGKYGGIFYDFMNEFERVSNIKVKWVHDVQYAQLVSDIDTEKVDAVCAGVWPSAKIARQIIFSEPLFFIPIEAYSHIEANQFDYNLKAINHPTVKIVLMDGLRAEDIKNSDFPNATPISIPQLSGSPMETLMLVKTKKADVTFVDAINGTIFMKENPNSIRRVLSKTPIRIMPNTIGVKSDEVRLKMFIDDVIKEIRYSGSLEKILARNDISYPNAIIRPANSYEVKN